MPSEGSIDSFANDSITLANTVIKISKYILDLQKRRGELTENNDLLAH